MIPVEHDFVDERGAWVGANWTKRLTYADDQGVGIDLTGWTITFVVYDSAGAVSLTLSSPSSGVTVTNASGGVFTVAMTAAQTTGLGQGSFTYKLSLTSGSNVIVLAVGRFNCVGAL